MKPRFTFIVALVISLTNSAFGYELRDCIPSDATFVTRIDFKSLTEKGKGENYLKYLKDILPGTSGYSYYSNCKIFSLNDMIANPDSFGINMNSDAYIYSRIAKNYSGTTYLLRLKDVKLFESQIKHNESCENPSYMVKRQTENGSIYFSEKMVIGISKDIAFIFLNDQEVFQTEEVKPEETEYEYYMYGIYPGEHESYKDSQYLAEMDALRIQNDSTLYLKVNEDKSGDYYSAIQSNSNGESEIIERAKERLKVKKIEALNKKVDMLSNDFNSYFSPVQNSIMTDRNFARLVADNHDLVLYVSNPVSQMQKVLNPFSRMHWRSNDVVATNPKPAVYTKNISSGYTVDFLDGKINVKSINTFGDEAFKYFERAHLVKQNKELFKYIDGNNLMAYFSSSTNVKEIATFYEKFYFELLDNSAYSKRDKNIAPGIELFWSMLDKEMIFGTFGNNQILAINGFIEAKLSYDSYEYDDEFVRQEVKKEKIVKQPKVTWVMGVNNKENARKLFDIISKFTAFTKIKDNIISMNASRELQFNLYIILNDDALILTNDPFLALEKPNGYDKNMAISKEDQTFMLTHNWAMKIYSNKLLTAINQNYPSTSDEMGKISDFANNMGDLTIFDLPPANNSYGLEATLSLNNSSVNSLSILLDLFKRL